jgi:hypothetical protein
MDQRNYESFRKARHPDHQETREREHAIVGCG